MSPTISSLADLDRHVVERGDAAEVLGDVGGLEQGVHHGSSVWVARVGSGTFTAAGSPIGGIVPGWPTP